MGAVASPGRDRAQQGSGAPLCRDDVAAQVEGYLLTGVSEQGRTAAGWDKGSVLVDKTPHLLETSPCWHPGHHLSSRLMVASLLALVWISAYSTYFGHITESPLF